jgi:isoleucyl-tRNA synthetase
MISKTDSLIQEVTEEIEKHNYHQCLKKIIKYIGDDFSRWYIKLIRGRTNKEDGSLSYTFYYVFDNLTRLMAPFAPYLAEYIQMNLFKQEKSIHFASWPKTNKKNINLELENSMDLAQEITSQILSEREREKIGVRWPLSKAKVTLTEEVKEPKELELLIKAQTNIKKLEFKTGKEFSVKLDTKLTEELELEGYHREVSRKIQGLRKKAGLQKQDDISLVIESDYNISKFEKELKEKVGAVNLFFGTVEGEFEFDSEAKIKDKTFRIAFNSL